MAISKVKLPDNSVQDIHDSRLPSVYPRIYVGTCSTAAATAAKVVTTEEFPLVNGNPVVGTTIAVKFTNTNSGASPTLNVNETGAHSIYFNNAIYTSAGNIGGYANRYSYFIWDGANWVWLSHGTDNDVSGKQDKWANVNIADNAITLAPTESSGALILADNEQVVGLGYMHNDENDELAGAHMISAAPDGVKIQSFDDYGYKSIDFNGNGVDMNNTPIAGLPTPTDSDEAATKGYVDSAIPTVPTISTNVVTDKTSDTKTSSPKSVYDEIHPSTQSSQPAGGFLPNVIYNLGTLSGNTTFALATPADSSVANHYYWTFDTGSTAPTITWPASITEWNGGSAPTINASKHYEISVLNGVGAFMEV